MKIQDFTLNITRPELIIFNCSCYHWNAHCTFENDQYLQRDSKGKSASYLQYRILSSNLTADIQRYSPFRWVIIRWFSYWHQSPIDCHFGVRFLLHQWVCIRVTKSKIMNINRLNIDKDHFNVFIGLRSGLRLWLKRLSCLNLCIWICNSADLHKSCRERRGPTSTEYGTFKRYYGRGN